MDHETIGQVIRRRFAEMVSGPKNLPTLFDNQDADMPDDVTWCRLTIRTGDTFRISIGNPGSNRERTHGVMIAQLFGPLTHGDGELRKLADGILDIFSSVNDSGVVFRTGSMHEVNDRGHNHCRVNVQCPFQADSFR